MSLCGFCLYVVMSLCLYVVMLLCLYILMSLCLYVIMLLCHYVVMLLCLCVVMLLCLYSVMSLCLFVVMLLCLYVSMSLCLYVALSLFHYYHLFFMLSKPLWAKIYRDECQEQNTNLYVKSKLGFTVVKLHSSLTEMKFFMLKKTRKSWNDEMIVLWVNFGNLELLVLLFASINYIRVTIFWVKK